LNKLKLTEKYKRDLHAQFDESQFVYELIHKQIVHPVMIDVGAHQGGSLDPFAKKGWRIYAFEPDPDNRKKLLMKTNGFPLVYIDSRAVTDKVIKSTPFYSSKESTGISCLNPFRETHQEVCRVSTTTLSAFCKEQNITSVDFLKIDTEGHDLMVLKGFPWDSINPKIILCEFENRKTVPLCYDFHKLAQFLIDKGYTVLVSEWHPIIRYGIKHDWCNLLLYPCQLTNSDSWGNLIAFNEIPDIDKVKTLALNLVKTSNQVKNDTPQQAQAAKTKIRAQVLQPPDLAVSRIKGQKITIRFKLKNALKDVYQKFALYLIHNHPPLARIGRFCVWSFRVIQKRLFGISGLTFLLILILLVGTYSIQDFRWFFLSCVGVMLFFIVTELVVSYTQIVFEQFADSQRSELRGYSDRVARDLLFKAEQKAKELHNEIINKANFLNAKLYHSFNRNLQDKHINRIIEFWSPTLDLKIEPMALGYLAHRICQIENICSGRLATNVQDGLLRILLAQSIKVEFLNVLEIGALFGVNLAILYNTCLGRFKKIHLTAIDPLDGYYGKNAYDIITNAPISDVIFEHNMKIMDIPEEDVTLIKALSTDKKALEAARKRSYNLLILDGDHSYNGVKFDFDHYHKLVIPGGYIIFDDYNSNEWPDVTNFVNQEVKVNTGVKLVGADWRMVIFQVL
jgi:FkbM family methyltransferase